MDKPVSKPVKTSGPRRLSSTYRAEPFVVTRPAGILDGGYRVHQAGRFAVVSVSAAGGHPDPERAASEEAERLNSGYYDSETPEVCRP